MRLSRASNCHVTLGVFSRKRSRFFAPRNWASRGLYQSDDSRTSVCRLGSMKFPNRLRSAAKRPAHCRALQVLFAYITPWLIARASYTIITRARHFGPSAPGWGWGMSTAIAPAYGPLPPVHAPSPPPAARHSPVNSARNCAATFACASSYVTPNLAAIAAMVAFCAGVRAVAFRFHCAVPLA